jgi:hypothetical protein
MTIDIFTRRQSSLPLQTKSYGFVVGEGLGLGIQSSTKPQAVYVLQIQRQEIPQRPILIIRI